jgi:predicted amidohydrolase YtcJ
MNTQLAWFILLVVCAALCTYLFFRSVPERADVLYVNGRIYTMDKNNSVGEVLAIRGGRIIAIGSGVDLGKRIQAKDTVDLAGKIVFPGFIDAHGHLMSLGIKLLTVDVLGVQSEAQAAAIVAEQVKRSESGQWVRGRGWDQNLWASKRFPTHEVLDRVSPANPVYLTRVDGHAAWVNKKAMEIAGITKQTPDTAGGRIIRDASGNPTGVFVDNAKALVSAFLPPPSAKEMEEAISLAVRECLRHGLTGMHDMGADKAEIDVYKGLIDKEKFPFRVYVCVDGAGETWDEFIGKDSSKPAIGPIIGYGDNRLWVRSVKLYVDGALGSRGAALLEPYSDDPTNRGLTVTDEASLRRTVDEALVKGFQVCTHAIGDRANNIILNVYEAALKAHPGADRRLRIEHAQVLSLNDIPRFKRLGIIPSMQPTHCTSDMYWAAARLGATRVRGAYAWRSLLNTGVIIPGGSDFPVEQPNPLLGIYAAVTRRDLQGRPRSASEVKAFFELSADGIGDTTDFQNGWYASQKMTREEAVMAFTNWAAFAGFQEQILGSLGKGKLADFVVLSRDIMKVPEEDIPTTVVEKTIVGGKEVYVRGRVAQK